MRDLRVISWNMYMYGVQEGKPIDPTMDSQAEYINTINPDIILIQEIDQATSRTSKRHQLEILRNKTELKYSAFEASEAVEVIGGSGILSRFPLVEIQKHLIPNVYYGFRAGAGPSYIVTATVDIEGELVRLYCNHWPPRRYREPSRLAAARLALQLMQNDVSQGRRIIFGGDLNAYICDPEVQILNAILTDALTVADSAPEWSSNCVIDHILFRGSFRVKTCRIAFAEHNGKMLSDHPIIIADFAEGDARRPNVWAEQNTGFIDPGTGDRIVFDILPNDVVNVRPEEVGFSLHLSEDVWWKKVINLPDGGGASWDIVAEYKGSGYNSLWATQVTNGQVLTFSKKVPFAMKAIYRLGDLSPLKSGSHIVFTWVKD